MILARNLIRRVLIRRNRLRSEQRLHVGGIGRVFGYYCTFRIPCRCTSNSHFLSGWSAKKARFDQHNSSTHWTVNIWLFILIPCIHSRLSALVFHFSRGVFFLLTAVECDCVSIYPRMESVIGRLENIGRTRQNETRANVTVRWIGTALLCDCTRLWTWSTKKKAINSGDSIQIECKMLLFRFHIAHAIRHE